MLRPKNPIWLNLNCLECGAAIRILQSQTKGGAGKFCSRSCAAKYACKHHNHLTPMTKERFAAHFGNVKKPTGRDHHGWQEPILFTCIFCDAGFSKKPWQTRGGGKKNLYCSIKCRSEHRKTLNGPNAPDYVGGALTYRGRDWPGIRLSVVEEQGGNCKQCGRHIGKSLPVHHIIPFRLFDSWAEANRRDNLVGMCQSCHMKTEPRGKGWRGLDTQLKNRAAQAA